MPPSQGQHPPTVAQFVGGPLNGQLRQIPSPPVPFYDVLEAPHVGHRYERGAWTEITARRIYRYIGKL